MSIQSSIQFYLSEGASDTSVKTVIFKEEIEEKLDIKLSDSISTTLPFKLLEYSDLEDFAKLQLVIESTEFKSYLQLLDPTITITSYNNLSPNQLIEYVRLFLDKGDIPYVFDPNKYKTYLSLIDPSIDEFIYGENKYRFNIKDFDFSLLTATGISDSDTIVLTDELGPEIFNEAPSSGSVFNNPLSTISFDLIDTGGAEIVQGTIKIYVNNTQIVDAGVDVTPPGYGTTTFTKINDSFYQLQFNSSNPFDVDENVIVSGTATDNITPIGNTNNFVYGFSVWGTEDLTASISGAPDIVAPAIQNEDPLIGSINVPIDNNIEFELYDEHTGLDFDSVYVYVDNTIVVSGGVIKNTDSYVTTISGLDNNKTGKYIINPVNTLEYGAVIPVEIYAEDLFTPPNILDTSYYFTVQENSHLVASGLNIQQSGNYFDMYIGETYIDETTTSFYIDYINTSGSNIDISKSYIEVNNSGTSYTYTKFNDNYYRLFFDLDTDYTQDADITFHVHQSGTVLGNEVYREFYTRLLWGYEACYENNSNFEYDIAVKSTVQAADFADKYSITSLNNRFTTRPLYHVPLKASIIGKVQPTQDIMGYLESNNPFHEYGKTMNMVLEAEDYTGNKLIYNWKYTIEEE